MPSAITHQIFALMVALPFCLLFYWFHVLAFDLSTILQVICIILTFSIMPDMDLGSSTIRKIFLPLALGLLLSFLILGQIMPALIICLILIAVHFLRHRGFLHSLPAALLFSIPLLMYQWTFALFAFVSYFSHLLIDKL
ncbi:metal-dependent hydrolase [Candidatus Woesearchaeota archaeon]|nr:metal-dependent hydrolase [Candidatus Woesearchaeota archaeon]